MIFILHKKREGFSLQGQYTFWIFPSRQLKKTSKGLAAAPSIRGFTLIETLVAVSILMIAVVIPLGIVSSALQYSYYARDQITAAYLAQDAIEYIRAVRDSNAIAYNNGDTPAPGWSDGLTGCGNADRPCQVDTVVDLQNGISPFNNQPLYYNENDHTYRPTSSGGSASRFTRSFWINSALTGNTNEMRIHMKVTWSGSGVGEKEVEVSESLYNVWQ